MPYYEDIVCRLAMDSYLANSNTPHSRDHMKWDCNAFNVLYWRSGQNIALRHTNAICSVCRELYYTRLRFPPDTASCSVSVTRNNCQLFISIFQWQSDSYDQWCKHRLTSIVMSRLFAESGGRKRGGEQKVLYWNSELNQYGLIVEKIVRNIISGFE